jgi:uncharacterized membrane protein
MLIRRSHEHPVRIPAVAGGKRMAMSTRIMSDDLTMVKAAVGMRRVNHWLSERRWVVALRACTPGASPNP